MKISSLMSFAAGIAAVAAIAAPAHALTFADYTPVGTGANFQWTQSTPVKTGGTLHAIGAGVNMANITFDFLTPGFAKNLAAKLTLTGFVPLGNAAGHLGTLVDQGAVSDSFSIIYTGATFTDGFGHTYTTGENLLSGMFTSGDITGRTGGTAGGLDVSMASGGTVTFTSSVLPPSFFGVAGNGISLALTSVTPGFSAATGQSLRSFKAVSAGLFETAAVPEPATWSLMIGGLGLVGYGLRRKLKATAQA